jgi:hypothetical protein
MKYRNTIIAIGFLLIVMPVLGFPRSWLTVFYILAGGAIITLGYLSGKETRVTPKQTEIPVSPTTSIQP